jgi:hypothetical protein
MTEYPVGGSPADSFEDRPKRRLYQPDDEGGMRVIDGRKDGEVRIPNYVFDLWLPVMGAEHIGVYSAYVRLARASVVSRISTEKMAKACRIGKAKLLTIHADLTEAGFMEIRKPKGADRFKHYTQEVTVLDPPKAVKAELIRKHLGEREYEPLTPWLAENESSCTVPDRTADGSKQNRVTVPDRTATQFHVEPPKLHPSVASLDDASLSGGGKQPSFDPAGHRVNGEVRDPLQEGEDLRVQVGILLRELTPALFDFYGRMPTGKLKDELAADFEHRLQHGQRVTPEQVRAAAKLSNEAHKGKWDREQPRYASALLDFLAAAINAEKKAAKQAEKAQQQAERRPSPEPQRVQIPPEESVRLGLWREVISLARAEGAPKPRVDFLYRQMLAGEPAPQQRAA